MVKKGENIYRRNDGRWEGRYIKQRAQTGKIIYGSVYGKKYSEVKEKLIKVKAKYLDSGSVVVANSGTLADWLSSWLTTKVRSQVKQTTYSNYCRMINKHILPALGSRPLAKLQAKELQKFVCFLEEQGLASGTIKNIFNIINKCLKEAQKQQFIIENPCHQVDLPKTKQKRVTALSLSQQRRLESAAFQEEGCSAMIIALYSGMRIGEISGLRWGDIDFENDLIHVKRTISRIIAENSPHTKTKLVADTPKSQCSLRQIPIAGNFKNYLLEKKQRAFSEYVVECDGRVAEPRTITNRFKKTAAQAGLEAVNFHLLRHTFATRCIEKGVDIVSLSKILGHQSVKMTLDTYTDSLMETRRAAMLQVDTLFCQTS